MNYSLQVKKELIEGAPRNACCKQAYAKGLFFDLREWREKCLVQVLSAAVARHECARVYRDLYRREALMDGSVMIFSSEKLFSVHLEPPQFKCPHCRAHFLRGLMVVCGSVTDPEKSYHLEFRISNAEKIPYLNQFFHDIDWDFKYRKIDFGGGFYSKKASDIENLLQMAGATNTLFSLMNAQIRHEIRNEENRISNCIARHIAQTVKASEECRRAIERLIDAGKFENLPGELKQTAQLRLEHDDATLSELASLHNPPITKSGLNHRLKRIIALAQGLDE